MKGEETMSGLNVGNVQPLDSPECSRAAQNEERRCRTQR